MNNNQIKKWLKEKNEIVGQDNVDVGLFLFAMAEAIEETKITTNDDGVKTLEDIKEALSKEKEMKSWNSCYNAGKAIGKMIALYSPIKE